MLWFVLGVIVGGVIIGAIGVLWVLYNVRPWV